MGKYEDLDEATRSQVDAAVEILKSDAVLSHNSALLERLDRLEARIPEPVTEPPEPPVANPPTPPAPIPPPPRIDPEPEPEPEPVVRKRGAWWGDRLHEGE